MFDDKFTIDDVRQAGGQLENRRHRQLPLEDRSTMPRSAAIPLELVKQTISEHQYPDGFVLSWRPCSRDTGPDVKGSGFTQQGRRCGADFHPQAGRLENRVTHLQGGAAMEFRAFPT